MCPLGLMSALLQTRLVPAELTALGLDVNKNGMLSNVA